MKIYDGAGTKWMCFMIEDKVLLKKYDTWNDVSNRMKNDFDSESIYNTEISENQNKTLRGRGHIFS